jgi:thiol-disulfide isomerase/thioredoxin
MKKINPAVCLTAIACLCMNSINAQQPAKTKQDTLKQYYVQLIKSTDPADKDKVKSGLKKLSNSRSEEDLILAMSLYSINKENKKSDSLLSVGVQRYPKGRLALIQEYNKAVGTKATAAGKSQWYKQWVSKFPAPKKNRDIVYDYGLSEVANAYAAEKNLAETQRWVDQIENAGYKSVTEMVSGQIFLEQKDTAAAEKMIRNGVLRAKQSYTSSEDPGAKGNYLNGVSTLANVLFLQGKYDEAMEYATIAYRDGNKKSVQIREVYALALSRTGKETEAMPVMEELVRTGLAGSKLKDELKRAYIKTRGSAEGYEAYQKDLNDQLRNKISEEVAKQVITEDSPSFSLKDLDGKTVSLADLKGKVVILDFWATWCGPCKKSFPAMQKAVDKYKADNNVCFLFIDTWERTANPLESVKSFITQNKYSFQVLLDNNTTNVVGKFGINGIPAKFVIDGKGKIRFKLTGFSGGDDAAVAELSAMIENARKS